jgi:hypothetical protein
MSSPLLALSKVMTNIACGFLLLVIGVAIFTSGVFIISPLPPNQQSAFATFPGENGKIAFVRGGGPLAELCHECGWKWTDKLK